MQVINDMISFIKTLTFVDIIFFFAVLALMLLIIILIYFVKENTLDDDINMEKLPTNNKNELLDNRSELENLKEITEALENAEQPAINLNKYE